MIPLPWVLENALGPPLQLIATSASTYFLQILGFMAFAQGNVIHLDDARIGVAEACSGSACSSPSLPCRRPRPWS